MSLYKRELIINVSFLILANLLIKPYYIFFIERNIQNEVGTAAWGIYFTLFSLSMVPQILLDLGLTSFINQRLSAHRDQFNALFHESVWIKPILACLFSLIYLCIAWLGGYLHDYHTLIYWILINQILSAGILFLRAFVSGLGHYRWDSFLSIADKLIFIILFTLGIFMAQISTVQRFLSIQFISLLIPCAIVGAWIIFKAGLSIQGINFSTTKKIIKQSLPYAGIFVLMVLYCRLEPVWLGQLRSDGALQSGIYASAYRLLDAANMMGFLFAGILLPMFSHAMAHQETHEYQSVFELAGRVMISIAILVSITIWSQHRYIMNILYKDSLPDILHVVIINLIPLTINYLFSTLLTAAGKAMEMNRCFLISIGINIAGHILFTPRYGAVGAAYVALFTQLATSVLLFYLIKQNNLVSFHWAQARLIIFSIILLLGLSWLIHFMPGSDFIKLIALFLTGIMSMVTIGMLPLKSILGLIQKNRQ